MSRRRIGAALFLILALCVRSAFAKEGILTYCLQPLSGPEVKQISVINADATANTMLTHSKIGLNYPDWSPDGNKIVVGGYVSDSTWSIYRLDAEGRNLVRLTTAPDVWDPEPDWSPDGSQIVFARRYPNDSSREELWIVDADGSNAAFTGIKGSAPQWSPDGRRFLYQTRIAGVYRIRVRPVDGGNATTLASGATHEMLPAWSPQAKKVAFTSLRDANAEIYVMNADGSRQERLTRNDVADYAPSWSPDGSHLAWSSDLPGDGHWEVYIMRADGADQTRLTHTPNGTTAINPDWKPVVENAGARAKSRVAPTSLCGDPSTAIFSK